MSVSPSYRQFVLDQLGRVAVAVRARAMFGGVGLYAGDHFFALIDSDTLYFKADEQTRGDFKARGMGPFLPFGDEREVMQYYEVPADVLEDTEALHAWVEKAVGVAQRARSRRGKQRPPRRSAG